MRDGTGRWGRVLLLGGTSEIGLAVLNALDLRPGATVLLAGRDHEALNRVPLPSDTLRECLAWDALDSSSGASLITQATSGGDLDLVIVAAGVLDRGAATDAAIARHVLLTNLVGVIDVLVPLGQALCSQKHGTVIVLSSVAGVRARKANFVYGASKAGLDAFAQGWADHLAPHGVRVVVVRPGFVHGHMTAGMTPAPLATTPDAVGHAVARALAGHRNLVWAPPAVGVLAAALRLLPRPLWRRLGR